MIFKDFEKEPVGYGSFKIFDLKKTFADITSSEKRLYSQKIEIFGTKWYILIMNSSNQHFGIFFFREDKEK